MRTSIDVIRSLQCYTYLALGSDWDTRFTDEEGTFTRPSARVLHTTPQTLTGPKWAVDVVQGFQVHAWPAEGANADESMLLAGATEEKLLQAFRIQGVGPGRPTLVPLWNYDAVPWDEASTARRKQDFAKILDLSIDRKPSPSDELKYTVVADLRLRWRRDGEQAPAGAPLREVRLHLSSS